MKILLEQAALSHLLLWVVPAVCGILCSAMGGRMRRPLLGALALAGLFLPWVQSLLGATWFLWFSGTAEVGRLALHLPGAQGDSAISFGLDAVGNWAALLATTLTAAALLQAAAVTRGWIGQHRYYALMLLLCGSVNLMATARSMLTMLFGWEAAALAGAFLLGFWEAEEGRRRTGMRWLLFQHVATACLLVTWLLGEAHPETAGAFLLAAAAMRLGLVPLHGWVAEQSRAPSSAQALVQSVASLLCGALLLDRFAFLILPLAVHASVLAAVGAATVLVGVLAALQQHRLAAALSWMVLVSAGLAALDYALADVAAARLLVTGHALVWTGWLLALGLLELAESGRAVPLPPVRVRWLVMGGLTFALVMPPGLSFFALGRTAVALPEGFWRYALAASLALVWLGTGWVLRRVWSSVERALEPPPPGPRFPAALLFPSALCAALVLLLGLLAVVIHRFDEQLFGGMTGAAWTAGGGLALVLGWLLSARHERLGRPPVSRLRRGARWMEWVAETGLGLGELAVQLPLTLFRAVGALVSRVVGDFVLEGMLIGGAIGLAEGLGSVLRFLHNGRVQRYIFFLVLAALVLLALAKG